MATRVNSWDELKELIQQLAPGLHVYWGGGGSYPEPHVVVKQWVCPGDFSRGYAYVYVYPEGDVYKAPCKVHYVEVAWPIG